MAATLLALFIIIPIVEIYLFIEIGSTIGAGWTILLIVATALYGMSAMRRQGLAVLAEAQAAQAAGRPPVTAAAHGLLILLGGAFLLTPGFMTDTLGILCLIGFVRGLILEAALGFIMPLMGGVVRRGNGGSGPHQEKRRQASDIIEGEYRVEDDEKRQ